MIGVLFALCNSLSAQDIVGYQKPPQPIVDMVAAKDIPAIRISSDGQLMIMLDMPDMPTIEELSQPELRLAGVRVSPATNGPSRTSAYTGIRLKLTSTGQEKSFEGLPSKLQLGDFAWSPGEDKVAFTNTTSSGIELWMADVKTMQAKRLSNLYLNTAYGKAVAWTPDGNSILAKFIDSGRKPISEVPATPAGPVIQESLGKSTAAPTYQDLLKNPYDENAFEYYFSAQLKIVDFNGRTVDFGPKGIIRNFDYSPDGQYVLLSMITRPYSYTVPINLFPYTTSLLSKQGVLVKKLADSPLADNLPSGFDAVLKGQREFGWRSDKPATLYWVEALDNGNPGQQATVRDVLYMQAAPFNLTPYKLAECYYRFHSVTWGDDKLAIVTERWFRTRSERRVFIKPSNETFRVNLFDRYYEDGYNDPGIFVTKKNEYGRQVLLTEFSALKRISDQDNVNLFMITGGASPEGDRPFLMRFNIKTKIRDTLFRSQAPYYERPVFFNNEKFIINSRESTDSITNYFRVSLSDKTYQKITDFRNPYPQLAGVQKQNIRYKRLDGIDLGGTLYLPKEFKKGDKPLPVVMWAYPREFKTIDAAGQVKGSPYQFTRLSSGSPVFWVTRGYAILDNADMPVVGESNKNPNDTFVEQVRYNAEAAINEMVRMGVADPKRIAVGGHSYGAFMTANLLAHTNLFAAGIARSGAYNRSLTPFGFQAEERTYWQAPDIYNRMSPFSYADKIKTPLLLLHGQADNNSGTFPLQSERLYAALKGHGAITRLVMLPSESHAYRARESVLHSIWEMDQWLEKHVKNK